MVDERVLEQEVNLENRPKSLIGEELPEGWPLLLSDTEMKEDYQVLYDDDEGLEAREKPPQRHPHVERLSYKLSQGIKELHFFATVHQRDINPGNINETQYEIIEEEFKADPPQLVLYEGYVDDVNYLSTRERAIEKGESAFMCYLVQEHNRTYPESLIVIESGDRPENNNPDDQVRDTYIIKNAVDKFKQYDRINIVFGSGHAVREKKAWEQFFGAKAESLR